MKAYPRLTHHLRVNTINDPAESYQKAIIPPLLVAHYNGERVGE